ncbi:putative transcriptional regulator [Aciduliprofundum sp. MAR08-339]|uniref:ArsR/SmtB family transcription factor n=1 Tax=Aciduliprofundum sp. (strain MAR08-339) TaxID=673860 RepID=UPI0002A49C13|nr:putative transcriptional regulator [Aciduliprofundum sp. MAR08-339]
MPKNIPPWLERELDRKGGIETIIKDLPPNKILTKEAKLHSALGDPVRLKILCFLGKQSSCVCLIKDVVKLTYSKLSYHLSVLKKAKLIQGKKDGNYIIYSLTNLGKKYYREICKKS